MNTFEIAKKIVSHAQKKGAISRSDMRKRTRFPCGKTRAVKVARNLEDSGLLQATTTTRNGTAVRWKIPARLQEEVRWRQKDEAARFDATVRADDSDSGGDIAVTVATNDLARDGMILEMDGLSLSSYRQNPVVLWNHGESPQRGSVPIGKATRLVKRSDSLLANVTFAEDDYSQDLRRKIESGVINAVSVGWRTLDSEGRNPVRVTKADMTEFSFVPVPADAGALTEDHATAEVVGA
jgi:hypothetical protein